MTQAHRSPAPESAAPLPARQDPALVEAASRAARRFQLAAQLHLSRSSGRALRRDGAALFDLLWRMGFRPARHGDGGAEEGLPLFNRPVG